MVRTDVGQDRHIRREGGRQVQLVARHLDHIDAHIGRGRQGEDADADVAADGDLQPGLFQHPADQRRGGGLPVRAGYGDDLRPDRPGRPVHGACEQFDVADDLDPRRLGLVDGPVRFRMGQGRAGRQDQGGELRPVGPAQVLDREALGLGLHPPRDAVVPQDGDGAPGVQRARRRDPRPSEAEDRDSPPFESGDGDHAPSAASAWRGRSEPAWRRRSRSGSRPSIPASPSFRNDGGSGPSGRCASWWP